MVLNFRSRSISVVFVGLVFLSTAKTQESASGLHTWATQNSGLNDRRTFIDRYKYNAERGDKEAQFQMGAGFEAAGNFVEAAKWYQAAAEQGRGDAQNNLGRLYLRGLGVAQDDGQAFQWFEKSAASTPTALGNLAYMYGSGRGVPADSGKAATLYKQAAERGDIYSMRHLAICFWQGTGVERNMVDAAKWVILARRYTRANSNNWTFTGEVKDSYDSILAGTTPEELGQAQKFAKQWHKENRKIVQPFG